MYFRKFEQERYHSLAPMYYRGAAAAIVVYDITNQVVQTSNTFVVLFLYFVFLQQSFARAKSWVKELQRQTSANVLIALAGSYLFTL